MSLRPRKGRRKPKSQLRARDFGDDPRIRGGLDRAKTHSKEPWEVRYARDKKRAALDKSKRAKDFKDDPKIRGGKDRSTVAESQWWEIEHAKRKGKAKPKPKTKPKSQKEKFKTLESALKKKGYKVDSSGVWDTRTIGRRAFVDKDGLDMAVRLGLTAEDIWKYGPRHTRKDGSAGRRFNPNLQDIERIAQIKRRK